MNPHISLPLLLVILLFPFYPPLTSAQNCDSSKYQLALKRADSLIKQGQFNAAYDQYVAAKILCPPKRTQVQAKQDALFLQINALRVEADSLRLDAEKREEIGWLLYQAASQNDKLLALRLLEHAIHMAPLLQNEALLFEYQKLIGQTEFFPFATIDTRKSRKSQPSLPMVDQRYKTFAFSHDGYSIGLTDGNLIFHWDLPSGKFKDGWGFEETNSGLLNYRSILFSPSTESFIASYTNSSFAQYSFTKRTRINLFSGDEGQSFTSLAIADKGNYLFGGNLKGQCSVWAVSSSQKIKQLALQRTPLRVLAVHPDGYSIFFSDSLGQVNRLDWQSEEILQTYVREGDKIDCLATSSDGTYLAVGYRSGKISLWEIESGKYLQSLFSHRTSITEIKFSPSGNFLYSGSQGEAILWEMPLGKQKQKFQLGTFQYPMGAFSLDGKYFALNKKDWAIDIYELEDKSPGPLEISIPGGFPHMQISPKSQQVVSILGSSININTLQSGAELHPFLYTGNGATTFYKDLSESGKYLLLAYSNKHLALWDLPSQQVVQHLPKIEGLSSLAISDSCLKNKECYEPGKVLFLLGFLDGKVQLWEKGQDSAMVTFQRKGDRLLGTPFVVTSLSFSPDRKQIFAGYKDGAQILWDIPLGKYFKLEEKDELIFSGKPEQERISSSCFSRDGKYLLTGKLGHCAKLWEVSTGKQLQQFVGHSKGIRHLAFSPDGKYVLTTSYGNKALIWKVDGSLAKSYHFPFTLGDAAFSEDGQSLHFAGWKEKSYWLQTEPFPPLPYIGLSEAQKKEFGIKD